MGEKNKEKTTNKNRTFTGLVDGFARWLVSNSIASEMHGNSRYNYHENGETSTKPFWFRLSSHFSHHHLGSFIKHHISYTFIASTNHWIDFISLFTTLFDEIPETSSISFEFAKISSTKASNAHWIQLFMSRVTCIFCDILIKCWCHPTDAHITHSNVIKIYEIKKLSPLESWKSKHRMVLLSEYCWRENSPISRWTSKLHVETGIEMRFSNILVD